VCWILDHIFVEEVDGAEKTATPGVLRAPAANAMNATMPAHPPDSVTIPVPRRRVARRPTLPERHQADPGIIIAPVQPPPRDSA
jgi:hypothetical protein